MHHLAALFLAVGLAGVACDAPEPPRVEDHEFVDHALKAALEPDRKKPER